MAARDLEGLRSELGSRNRKAEVSVLGQSDQVVEYHPEIKPTSSWHQEKDGLHVRVM